MKKNLVVVISLVLLGLSYFSNSAAAAAATTSHSYVFPISGCQVTYAHSHHNYPATDILTKVGCAFVAPTSGIVNEVNRIDRYSWKHNLGKDRGGIYISILGDDGVRYYGSHLSKLAVGMLPGVRVVTGQMLGTVGSSGDAKGTVPHLHFGISWPTKVGIWWVRRGELYPWPFLDAWRAGKNLSPAKSIQELEKKLGQIPPHMGY
jgi:murein DD-endopeptidase MepM/ murein hydrolase activator NlpD